MRMRAWSPERYGRTLKMSHAHPKKGRGCERGGDEKKRTNGERWLWRLVRQFFSASVTMRPSKAWLKRARAKKPGRGKSPDRLHRTHRRITSRESRAEFRAQNL